MKILLFILLLPVTIYAKTLRVAVIDGGFSKITIRTTKLCPGQSVFQTETENKNFILHGSKMTDIIKKHAGNTKMCFILIQGIGNGLNSSANAFKLAIKNKADVINYSGGGYDEYLPEKLYIKKFLNNGGKLFAAAGNDKKDLTKFCGYFPACYDKRIFVVGNKDYYSNKIKNMLIIEQKTNGTSESTAIATGLYIKIKGNTNEN